MTLADIAALGIREDCLVAITGTASSPDGFRADALPAHVASISRPKPGREDDFEAVEVWPQEDRHDPREAKLWFPVAGIESLTHDPDCGCEGGA